MSDPMKVPESAEARAAVAEGTPFYHCRIDQIFCL